MSIQKKTSTHRGGPRTAEGKLRSSRNARKHSLLTSELHLSAEEESEFNDLKMDLLRDLMPNTAILQLLFEVVVADAWRMKLALRGEQRAVKKQLDSRDDPQPSSEEVRMDFPYALSASELRPRLQVLEDARACFVGRGSLTPDLEESLSDAFGGEFWKTLTDWNPLNTTLVRLLEATVERARVFRTELPGGPPSPEQERLYMEHDTKSRFDMVLKLFNMKKQELLLALNHLQPTKSGGTSTSEEVDRLDLYLRYQTTARREFYRALREYREAKARSDPKTG